MQNDPTNIPKDNNKRTYGSRYSVNSVRGMVGCARNRDSYVRRTSGEIQFIRIATRRLIPVRAVIILLGTMRNPIVLPFFQRFENAALCISFQDFMPTLYHFQSPQFKSSETRNVVPYFILDVGERGVVLVVLLALRAVDCRAERLFHG